ncbi:MAG: hypothetical protein ACREOR_06065, partial [Candidatus Binatia bacterium]
GGRSMTDSWVCDDMMSKFGPFHVSAFCLVASKYIDVAFRSQLNEQTRTQVGFSDRAMTGL